MTHWLAARRNEIGITQRDLAKRIKKSLSSVANWELGRTISMLAEPNEALILADALEWDITSMFRAAGYPIDVPTSESVRNVIEEIHKLKPHLVDAFCHMLIHFIVDFRENLSDIDPQQLIQDVEKTYNLPIEKTPDEKLNNDE